jgi:hypothetical protein
MSAAQATETRRIDPTDSDDTNRRQAWTASAAAAARRYLSEGVRILGEAYTNFDDPRHNEGRGRQKSVQME